MDEDYHSYQIYQHRFPLLVAPEEVPPKCSTCNELKEQCQKMYKALDTLQRYCTVLLKKQTTAPLRGGGSQSLTQEDWDRCSSALIELIPTGQGSSLALVQKMLSLLRDEQSNETIESLKRIVEEEVKRATEARAEQARKQEEIVELQARIVLLEQQIGSQARENTALQHRLASTIKTALDKKMSI